MTLLLVGFGGFGVYHMERNYENSWYMDENTYQYKFYDAMSENFPEHGERVELYIGEKYWDCPKTFYLKQNHGCFRLAQNINLIYLS